MKHKLLIAIIILAAFLRFYKLGSFPVSLYWDEVANGYNAYSIAQTGKDEYGQSWPLLFKSFNDFKLPGYVYLDAVFIKFLSLSEFSARLPSALLGTLAVLLMYFLTKELFKNGKYESVFLINQRKKMLARRSIGEAGENGNSETFALCAMFLLAISPWHLQFSRAAFEANISLTLILFGLVCLFYGLRNRFFALLSTPALATSIFFYHSPKIVVPLIALAFFILFKKSTFKNIRYYLVGILISLLFTAPLIVKTVRPEGTKHISEISIFADKSKMADYVDAKSQNPGILSSLFLNRRIPYVFEATHNYFSHFSFGFLFFGDDPNPRHHSSYHGNMYLFEIPLFFLGAWILIKKVELKSKLFLIIWLLISPLAAAFAQQSPHALRSLLMLPSLILISSLGLGAILFKEKIYKLFLFIIIALFFLNYIYSYYFVYPIKNSASWAYGYKQLFSQIAKIENNYDTIIVTGHYWKPYIFYLFYNKIDPRSYYERSEVRENHGQKDVGIYFNNWNQEQVGKYRFGTTYWDSGGKDLDDASIDSVKGVKTLVAISPEEFQSLERKERFSRLFTISDYSQKQEVFLIGEWQ